MNALCYRKPGELIPERNSCRVFFARRIVFVEGAAELFLFEALASRLKYELSKHAVSVISADCLSFDAFLPLFGEKGLQVPVVVLTDGDSAGGYPKPGESLEISDAAKGITALADKFVRPFFAEKTFEYDLAMDALSRNTMLTALAGLHPVISKELAKEVKSASEEERAMVLFKGSLRAHRHYRSCSN